MYIYIDEVLRVCVCVEAKAGARTDRSKKEEEKGTHPGIDMVSTARFRFF
jgi:hypothetical protein